VVTEMDSESCMALPHTVCMHTQCGLAPGGVLFCLWGGGTQSLGHTLLAAPLLCVCATAAGCY
jgi:hypothetical protein